MRFRTKPVVIEAIQWKGENLDEIKEFAGEALRAYYLPYNALSFGTLEARVNADVGDWIVRGVVGEFYPVKPGVFEANYEAV